MKKLKEIRGALFGLCTGDALGLPVQFCSREWIKRNPVQTMIGYGTFNKPPGTWSDDSSLTFCLTESLCEGFDLEDIGKRFVSWVEEGYWSADTRAFDIGRTTLRAVSRLKKGVSPKESGDKDVNSNGNGSLMRILPLAFYMEQENIVTLMTHVHQVSAITHAHPVSEMACGFYVVLAVSLLKGCSLKEAYFRSINTCLDFYSQKPYQQELSRFSNVLSGKISCLKEEEINSGGYVVDTLESALWCLLRNNSYRDTVLKAVNLGHDTDTTAAVAGGLAGLYYGFDNIPVEWTETLARREEIQLLLERFSRSL